MASETNPLHPKRLATSDFTIPFVLVTDLSFFRGVAHSLPDVLNKDFQDIPGITLAKSNLKEKFNGNSHV